MAQYLGLLGVAVAVMAVVALHMLMARKGPVWLGAVVPVLWSVVVAMFIAQGRLENGRPYLVSFAGLVMLLWMWVSARQTKTKAKGRERAGLHGPGD